MANLPNNPFAELRNLEARVDGRLEVLGRAENNLRTLLDSLREQVAAAFPMIEQLTKLMPECRETAEMATKLPNLGELSAAMAVGMDQAREELESRAGEMRQSILNELETTVANAKITILSAEAAGPSRADLADLIDAFKAEARDTLDRVRETLADQLELLPADAKMRLEPVLNSIDARRREAEGMVRAAAEGAEADMRRRAEQLRQSVDDISVVLEQRLTQRTATLQQRAEQAMNALRPMMDERLTSLLGTLEQTIQSRERELVARIDAYPQRLDRQLADAEALLMDRLARTERHALDMTTYLENKLTTRVDELVARLRLKLQQELNQAAGTPTPEPRPAVAAGPMAIDRPTLEASVFVQNVRRPNLSPAA